MVNSDPDPDPDPDPDSDPDTDTDMGTTPTPLTLSFARRAHLFCVAGDTFSCAFSEELIGEGLRRAC